MAFNFNNPKMIVTVFLYLVGYVLVMAGPTTAWYGYFIVVSLVLWDCPWPRWRKILVFSLFILVSYSLGLPNDFKNFLKLGDILYDFGVWLWEWIRRRIG